MLATEREEEGLSLGLWTNERTLLFFYTVFEPFITRLKGEDTQLDRYHQEGRKARGDGAAHAREDDVDKHNRAPPC